MFKTNGDKALAAVCLVTVIFIAMAMLTGAGSPASAAGSLEPAVLNYFEKMPDDLYRIEAAELAPLVEAGSVYVVDIRNTSDYEQDHIKGAVNIPFAQVGRNLDKIAKDKMVVVYCYTGQNGGQAVAALNLLGYNAKSLSGGWGGWLSLSGGSGQAAVVDCPT